MANEELTALSNPFPVLYHHFNIGKQTWAHMLPTRNPTPAYLQSLYHKPHLTERLHWQMFDQCMTIWGTSVNERARKHLWECYFPDTLPHVLHILVYRVGTPRHFITRELGVAEHTILKLLKRSKMRQLHLRRIAKLATQIEESLRRQGDPLASSIHIALRSRSRIYEQGQIFYD